MLSTRRAMLGVLLGAAVLLHAGAAFAHEEINPNAFPTGRPTFLVLSAANEAKADLVRLTLAAPPGLAFGATTREPAGWTVNRTEQLITWSGGSVAPDHFDQWGFEIEGADQPGTLTYKVTLGYADGTSEDASVDVTVTVAGGSAAAPSTADTGKGGSSSAGGAYAIAVAALLLAVVALVRTRPRRVPADGSPPAPATAAEAQDW
ncbi:MAG: YcnI family protein [Actinomycetota bacterium]|nr:YcnI family protein [Actinomycetota bacterium]